MRNTPAIRTSLCAATLLALALAACDSASTSGDEMTASPGAAAPAAEGLFDAFAPGPFPDGPDAADIWRQRPDIPDRDHGPRQPRQDRATMFSPPAGGLRTALTLSATHAAWVEREGVDGAPTLMIWPLDGDDPLPLTGPNLSHPTALTLGDGWLFYVDDRYGDPDVFAVNLTTGQDRHVVALPGVQDRPSARGSRVLWQDCRACMAGGAVSGREIYTWDAVTDAVTRLTDDDVEDHAPRWGTSLGGALTPVWLAGARTVRVGGTAAGAVEVLDADTFASVAMTQGTVTARESRGILNPDSMIPSDVWQVDVAAATWSVMSTHVEIAPGLPIDVQARGDRVAWLASEPGEPGVHTLVVTEAATGETVLSETLLGPDGFALTEDHVGFIALGTDGEGPATVWIAPLP